ncbi:hypothetical protein J6590_074006 [Homalodisca vitripennis]|nr:hypothetical protein J6590_074006 [Homalodisca vitripennis]
MTIGKSGGRVHFLSRFYKKRERVLLFSNLGRRKEEMSVVANAVCQGFKASSFRIIHVLSSPPLLNTSYTEPSFKLQYLDIIYLHGSASTSLGSPPLPLTPFKFIQPGLTSPIRVISISTTSSSCTACSPRITPVIKRKNIYVTSYLSANVNRQMERKHLTTASAIGHSHFLRLPRRHHIHLAKCLSSLFSTKLKIEPVSKRAEKCFPPTLPEQKFEYAQLNSRLHHPFCTY